MRNADPCQATDDRNIFGGSGVGGGWMGGVSFYDLN